MEIYKSGKITFEGEKNIGKIGKYVRQIEKQEVENLIQDFENANFFNFEDEYTEKVTDLPTTYIFFVNKDKTKKNTRLSWVSKRVEVVRRKIRKSCRR